jgi:hypothetical protein
MRMLKKSLLTITLILFTLPLHAAEFTADSHVEQGGQVKEAVFYFAKGKWRMNEHAPEGKRATIFREDTKTLTVLWPDKKLYLTQVVPEQQYKMLSKLKPGEELHRTELGHEVVSGYRTIKYQVQYLVQGRQFTEIEWYSNDLDVVVKTRAEDNSHTAQLTNIRKIKLSKKIFEVPSDYRLVTKDDMSKMKL